MYVLIQSLTRNGCFLLQISKKIISMKQWFRHCFVVMYSWQWQSCRKCPRKLTRNSHVFTAKPISLVERCHCRVTVNNIPKGYIRELRFIQTPSCPFQVMWVLLFYIYIYKWICILVLKHHVGFLFIGHFSPSISARWRAREKSCACMCTRTPLLSLTFTHTHTHWEKVVFTTRWQTRPQEVLHLSMSKSERERWELKVTLFWTAKQ